MVSWLPARLQISRDMHREVRERTTFGVSAREMIILDEKETYQGQIDGLARYRRCDVPNVRKLLEAPRQGISVQLPYSAIATSSVCRQWLSPMSPTTQLTH
jgi:hypothetical protein